MLMNLMIFKYQTIKENSFVLKESVKPPNLNNQPIWRLPLGNEFQDEIDRVNRVRLPFQDLLTSAWVVRAFLLREDNAVVAVFEFGNDV